jgi:hypothetical protein
VLDEELIIRKAQPVETKKKDRRTATRLEN